MRAKISPPLRDREQQEWLWRGVLAGNVNSSAAITCLSCRSRAWTCGPNCPAWWPFRGNCRSCCISACTSAGCRCPLVQLNSITRRAGSGYGRARDRWRGHRCGSGAGRSRRGANGPAQRARRLHLRGLEAAGWPVLTVSNEQVVVFEHGEVDDQAFGLGRCLTRPG